ncbi:Aldo/keto reductase [Dichomitus squalens]|nr:Aldo/keto reductase [Dichomitus squalens]
MYATSTHISSSFTQPRTGHDKPILGLGVAETTDCVSACLAALKYGYRHFDTARHYKNEEEVGRAIRESGIPREEIFVTSKFMATDHGYEDTLRAVDDSLQKFGYDHFDLYLIHSPLSGQEKRLGTWRALIDAKNAGKVKSIGVSNYSGKHIDEIRAAGLELLSVNQIELHPLCQQRPIVKYCQENDIVVEAYSPLARSKLGGPVLQRLTKLVRDCLACFLRWLTLTRIFVPLPKSSHRERILSNSQVYDFELSDEDMAALDALDKGKAGSVTWNPVDAD